MRRKLAHIVAIVATLAGLTGIGLAAAEVAASAQPLAEVCNNPDPLFGFQCANVQAGHYVSGQPVIAWDHGDENNFFEFVGTSLCGTGYVTANCPFTIGSGLNLAYQGDQIVEVENPTSGLCIGIASPSAIKSILTSCGSGWGSYEILQYANPGPGQGFTPYNVMVNRNWSDVNWSNHNVNGCYGLTCSAVVGMAGHGYPFYMANSDINVERGDFSHALNADQWAEQN